MMHIQRFDKQALRDFAASERYKLLPELPISDLRVESQLKNPRLRAGDILLYIAWIGDDMAGYLGVLPDEYLMPDGSRGHCGWLSCLWVNPVHRGQSIAGKMVTMAVEDMHGQILLTEYAPESRGMYNKLGLFSDLTVRTGVRLYYRFDLHRILPPRRSFFMRIRGLLKLTDVLANFPIDAFRYMVPARIVAGSWEYLDVIDRETANFIASQSNGELFQRGATELNWALEYPWLREGPEDVWSRRYHFSWVDNPVDFLAMRVRDEHRAICAFFVLMRRGRTMKMPVCYLVKGMEKTVAAVIDLHRSNWGINTFTTFHPEMVQYYQTCRTFALHKKHLKRHYIAANTMVERLKGVEFRVQDGDGDVFFT